MYINDSIAAISTPLGEGGVAVIRVSGDRAVNIGEKLFRRKPDGGFESHRFYYGKIVDPDDGKSVDEAMVVLMKAPRSYTREDVFEIQCHGGYLVAKKVLGLVLRNGARLAQPGEFTKRAFLNGRIDLVQAEAVIDVIRGKTEAAISLAQNHREGILSGEIERIKDNILNALTIVEAHIDFPEEEIGTDNSNETKKIVSEAVEKIKTLLEGYEEGRSLREGVSVLIAGKPNVGKSSLLNALVKEMRAIVNPNPGTTRDVIEEVVNIKGLPVKMFDTAGICETDDVIEREGVELALEKVRKTDLILFVLDSSSPVDSNDLRIAGVLEGRNYLAVINKCDLDEKISLPESLANREPIYVSAKSGEGIEKLQKAIYDSFFHGKAIDSREYFALSNIRHREALVNCLKALKRFERNVTDNMILELLAVELRDALQAIGEVTGETIREEVLERIFERFCIGK